MMKRKRVMSSPLIIVLQCNVRVMKSHDNFRETLIKSSMNRVADKIAMIARSATKVVARTCPHNTVRRSRLVREWGRRPFPRQRALPHRVKAAMPRSATPRARDFIATRTGTGFAGGLLRCAPCEGHQPFAASHALHPIPQSRVRGHVGLNQCFLSSTQTDLQLLS